MFCTKCGTKNEDDALFCMSCGNPMKKPQQKQPTEEKVNQFNNASVNSNVEEKEQSVEQQIKEPVINLAKEPISEEIKEAPVAEPVVESSEVNNIMNNDTNNIGFSFFQQEPANEEPQQNQFENIEPQQNQFENAEPQQSQFENAEPQQSQFENAEPQQSQFANAEPQQSQFENAEPQQSQFANEEPQQNQFVGNQNTNTYGNVDNSNKPSKKFSVKRFIFSALLIIISLASIACISMSFLTSKTVVKSSDDKDSSTYKIKGYEIIKDGVDDDTEEVSIDGYEDVTDAGKTVRVIVIILAVCLVVFGVIEFVLLVAVRKRWAYVLTMIFGLINVGLGGFIIYQWCFKILDLMKKVFAVMLDSVDSMSMTLTAGVGLGLILIMAAQGLVVIFSIILMTCKNNKKIENYNY